MTTFSTPVYLGVNTGAPTTDTRAPVTAVHEVTISQASRKNQITLPAGSSIYSINAVCTGSVVASVGQGVKITVGTSASPALFANINNIIAEGPYNGTLTGKSFLTIADGVVVVEATVSVAASASDFTSGEFVVRVEHYTRS